MLVSIVPLNARGVIPDLLRNRHDGSGGASKDVVDFKSTVLNPLLL
jgi:hypothetical protein